MAETMTPPAMGTFCWTECGTRDVAAAKKFYGELIGWTLEDQDMGGMTYTFIKTASGETVGGIYNMEGPQFEGVPAHWMPYILVDNVDARCELVKQLGGEVRMPPMDIPNYGRFAVIADPTGAVVALFQNAG
ncbi:MAG: VOC family protein [Fimbriimonadaceae bacterium]|nr:VOC family protein [Fimbriimonadaceae bacterium]